MTPEKHIKISASILLISITQGKEAFPKLKNPSFDSILSFFILYPAFSQFPTLSTQCECLHSITLDLSSFQDINCLILYWSFSYVMSSSTFL
mgnify:CR=1 FL=1